MGKRSWDAISEGSQRTLELWGSGSPDKVVPSGCTLTGEGERVSVHTPGGHEARAGSEKRIAIDLSPYAGGG